MRGVIVCALAFSGAPSALAFIDTTTGTASVFARGRVDDAKGNPILDDQGPIDTTVADIVLSGFDQSLAADVSIPPHRGYASAAQHTTITAKTVTSSGSVSSGFEGPFSPIALGSSFSRLRVNFVLPEGGHWSFPSLLISQQGGFDVSLVRQIQVMGGDTVYFGVYEAGDYSGSSGDLPAGHFALVLEFTSFAANFAFAPSSAQYEFEFVVTPAPSAAASLSALAVLGLRRRRA